MSPYATHAYDTVWTIAQALESLIDGYGINTNPENELNGSSAFQGQNVTSKLMDVISGLSFDGLSVSVYFIK